MFRLPLRPSPVGFALGVLVIAFWALLWMWFLAQLSGSEAQIRRASAPVAARTFAQERRLRA